MSRPARKSAAALRYEQNQDEAPRLAASGRGAIADRILEIARENGIPIREDPNLIEALAGLEIGETIPPKLYAVVAEVFAWLYALDRDVKGGPSAMQQGGASRDKASSRREPPH